MREKENGKRKKDERKKLMGDEVKWGRRNRKAKHKKEETEVI